MTTRDQHDHPRPALLRQRHRGHHVGLPGLPRPGGRLIPGRWTDPEEEIKRQLEAGRLSFLFWTCITLCLVMVVVLTLRPWE